MVGHSPKNKKLKAKQPKENVLTAACGQSPWNKKSKAAQTNKDMAVSVLVPGNLEALENLCCITWHASHPCKPVIDRPHHSRNTAFDWQT